jgi:hypothetical protein
MENFEEKRAENFISPSLSQINPLTNSELRSTVVK